MCAPVLKCHKLQGASPPDPLPGALPPGPPLAMQPTLLLQITSEVPTPCILASTYKMAVLVLLDFRCPVMGSLKSPCATSYRSSIDTVALNCLVFEKIAFLHFGVKTQDGGSPPSWILGVQ